MSAKTFGLVVVVASLIAGSVAPASAEFFGCNEPRTKVSYSTRAPAYRSYARAYDAPRQQHASYYSSQSRRAASQWR